MSAPRIRPVGPSNPLAWAVAQAGGKQAGTEPMKIFLTLGRHARLFATWLPFAGSLMPGGVLKRRESEMVILRVAHLRQCAYEFQHHVILGRRAGVDAADVLAGPAHHGWSPRERAILTAVDELHHTRDLGDDTWQVLRDHISEREAIELCMLVGHYEMLATTITALRIEPDRSSKR